MDDIILGNKILLSKKYSTGTVYMLEMPCDMITVIGFDKYEVAPGSSGLVEFKIPKSVTNQLMNN